MFMTGAFVLSTSVFQASRGMPGSRQIFQYLKQKMPLGKSSPQDGGSCQAPKVKDFSTFQLPLAPSLQPSGTMGLPRLLTNAFMFHIRVQAVSRFHICNATSESA